MFKPTGFDRFQKIRRNTIKNTILELFFVILLILRRHVCLRLRRPILKSRKMEEISLESDLRAPRERSVGARQKWPKRIINSRFGQLVAGGRSRPNPLTGPGIGKKQDEQAYHEATIKSKLRTPNRSVSRMIESST